MTRPVLLAAALVAAVAAAAPSAEAKKFGGFEEGVFRFPSTEIPEDENLAALKKVVQATVLRIRGVNYPVRTIVVAPGTYDVGPLPIFVFGRADLEIRGATGDPRDCVFTSSVEHAITLQNARRIRLRDLSFRTTGTRRAAVSLNAAPSADRDSYAEDVFIDGCDLSGYFGVRATVGARNLTMVGSHVTLTQSAGTGGVGVYWQDGDGLFLARNRFRTADDAPSSAAVFVEGAQNSASDGRRARKLLFLRNSVDGDFARAFDLADVVETRLRGNRITFPTETTETALPGLPAGSGRIGIVVRFGAASAQPEDFELLSNRVRGAFYGAWLVNTGPGVVRKNDFRRCGSSTTNATFGDRGAALRLNLISVGFCQALIERNDFRDLRSPIADPAVSVFPQGGEADCFPTELGNRVDKGRDLYLGEQN